MVASARPPRVNNTGVIDYFNQLSADYNATKQSRFKRVVKGLPANGAGADYHYRSESQYLALMEMVRDFERNDPIIKAGFNRLVSNIVQGGFTLDVATGDDEVDKLLAEKWLNWSTEADNCDISGEQTFVDMERLAPRAVFRDGDISAVTLASGHLKWYEGHRLRTPKNTKKNVVLGVLLDEHRRRQEYWFTRDEIEPWRSVDKVGDMTQIAARDAQGNRQVLHLYYPDRFSQTRGVTVCAPVVDTIGMHDDIQFAKMVQQKMVSCYAVFRKRRQWKPGGADDAITSDDYSQGLRRVLEDIYPGMVIDCDEGEELQGFSPNVPNAEFFSHAMLLLGFIAAALDLPLQVLLLDPTKTNFSGWRGAIDQARIRFEEIQRWLIRVFHTPVYRWKVRQWLKDEPYLQDALARGVNIFGHQWNPPSWSYIEPEKDAKAESLIVATSLSSRRRVLARRGLEHSKIAIECAEDNGQIIAAAIEQADALNTKYSAMLKKHDMKPVDWHEVMGLPLADGYSMKIGEPEPEPPAETKPPKKEAA